MFSCVNQQIKELDLGRILNSHLHFIYPQIILSVISRLSGTKELYKPTQTYKIRKKPVFQTIHSF